MSVDATRWAIDTAPADLGGSAMAVLLVMADLANRARWWQVWIPREEIGRRARVVDSTAGTALKTLERDDLISRVEADDRHPDVRKASPRTVVWRLHVEIAEHRNPADQTPKSGVQESASPLFPRTQDERNAESPHDSVKERKRVAREIASAWWEWKNPRPMMPYIAAVKIVEEALKAGWSRGEIGRALKRLDGPLVKWALERELDRARKQSDDDDGPADPQSGMDNSRRAGR